MSLFLPKLKYELDELEPFISARTMDFHYNKHFQNYINTANTLIQDTDFADKSLKEIVQTSIGPIFNNAAQAFNHEFYFNCLCPKGKAVQIPSALAEAINDNFGSLANFKEQFTKNAIGNFGSGWTWLVQNPVSRKLSIVNTGNAATPLTDGMSVLLCIDVWEHAYYLDYQNRRKDYVLEFFDYIDWDFVASNLIK
ncbi:MAG: superoxide dismutase [Ruminobacter sp.]|jgi:Fe-Mn family superoxide dismutase|uniref:superoxide dismutase n=1 Tax=Ruminobacter TaxID=866 RepID=UPI0004E14F82|nr:MULTISPECIES: superoxide dismutase [unclassified Ruminobacter]MBQ3775071.1 superoxide dismutase [Ruminobacter sp.]